MIQLVALILCADGGQAALPALSIQVQIPKWGATEEEVRRVLPGLEDDGESDVGNGKTGWMHQEIDSDLLGVRVFSLALFLERHRLARVLFDFGRRLDAQEEAQRQALWGKFQNMFGEPYEEGACWKAWKAEDGVVVVEPGRIHFFAPGTMIAGVDRLCFRLVPIRIPLPKSK